MKSCRKTIGIAAALLSIAVICVTFFQVTSAKASDKLVIRLAHNQAAGSEIADSIALISDIVAEDASMNMEVQIYPSGVLGTEKDIIEMVKAGILDMAKVSSNTLGQFKEEYSIFAVPYLFNGQQHYYECSCSTSRFIKASRRPGAGLPNSAQIIFKIAVADGVQALAVTIMTPALFLA